MSIIATIKEKARADKKYILLPEGTEERTVQAARLITDDGIAKVALLGNDEEIKSVADALTDMVCSISGTGGWREAMVTAGGVSLKEVNLKNMSLTSYPHIQVIGEALDINGDTGGYNLQFAYSSAMAALSDSI